MTARRLDLASWVSAISNVLLVVVAVYTIFFSPASEALLHFLQSELAARNTRIASLEAQEKFLQTSIFQKADELRSLEGKIAELEQSYRETTTQLAEATAELTKSEFLIVREKIGRMTGGIVDMLPFQIQSELFEKGHVAARDIDLWPRFLETVRSTVAKLSDAEQVAGKVVIGLVTEKCSELETNVVHMPERQWNSETMEYSEDDGFAEKFYAGRAKLEDCLQSLEQ